MNMGVFTFCALALCLAVAPANARASEPKSPEPAAAKETSQQETGQGAEMAHGDSAPPTESAKPSDPAATTDATNTEPAQPNDDPRLADASRAPEDPAAEASADKPSTEAPPSSSADSSPGHAAGRDTDSDAAKPDLSPAQAASDDAPATEQQAPAISNEALTPDDPPAPATGAAPNEPTAGDAAKPTANEAPPVTADPRKEGARGAEREGDKPDAASPKSSIDEASNEPAADEAAAPTIDQAPAVRDTPSPGKEVPAADAAPDGPTTTESPAGTAVEGPGEGGTRGAEGEPAGSGEAAPASTADDAPSPGEGAPAVGEAPSDPATDEAAEPTIDQAPATAVDAPSPSEGAPATGEAPDGSTTTESPAATTVEGPGEGGTRGAEGEPAGSGESEPASTADDAPSPGEGAPATGEAPSDPATDEAAEPTIDQAPALTDDAPSPGKETPAAGEPPSDPATDEAAEPTIDQAPATDEAVVPTIDQAPALTDDAPSPGEGAPATGEAPSDPATDEAAEPTIDQAPALTDDAPSPGEGAPATGEAPSDPATDEAAEPTIDQAPATDEAAVPTIDQVPSTADDAPSPGKETPATDEAAEPTIDQAPATDEAVVPTIDQAPALTDDAPSPGKETPATGEAPDGPAANETPTSDTGEAPSKPDTSEAVGPDGGEAPAAAADEDPEEEGVRGSDDEFAKPDPTKDTAGQARAAGAGKLDRLLSCAHQCDHRLEPLVDFWVGVFSRINGRQGYVHDARYPWRVFATIDIPKRSRSLVRNTIKRWRRELNRLANTDSDDYTEAQRRLASQFEGLSKRRLAREIRASAKRLRIQVGQSNYFRAGLARAGRYRRHYSEIFLAHGVPGIVLALPLIESAYNNRAVSHAGAAGMWQFMRSTARRYVQVNRLVDERLDPYLAAEAAAKLLRNNYDLTGSWPLAITAYNHGAAGMLRAKRQLGTDDIHTIIHEYRGRRFRFASRNFYVELLAAWEIYSNPQRYFPGIVIEGERPAERIVLDRGYVSAQSLAGILGVDVGSLRRANLHYSAAVWRGDAHFPVNSSLLLPKGLSQQAATRALRSSDAKLWVSRQKAQRLHTIARGETLSDIADYYGVRISRLRDINNLRGSRIYAGHKLILPHAAAKLTPAELAKLQARVNRSPRSEPPRRSPPSQESIIAARAKAEQEGEATALAMLSDDELLRRFSERSASMASLGRDGAGLGDGLGEAASIEEQLEADELRLVADPLDYAIDDRGYLVSVYDETLGHYADWLEIPTQRLRRLNGLRFGRSLQAGQRLRLDFSQVDVQTFYHRRLAWHLQEQNSFFSRYQIAAVNSYRVRRGDNIWMIVKRQAVSPPLWLVEQLNPQIDMSSLSRGQIIRLPELRPIGGGIREE